MKPSDDWQLLEAYVEGTLAPEDLPRLQDLLRADPAARQQLRALCRLDSGLRDLAADDGLAKLWQQAEAAKHEPAKHVKLAVSDELATSGDRTAIQASPEVDQAPAAEAAIALQMQRRDRIWRTTWIVLGTLAASWIVQFFVFPQRTNVPPPIAPPTTAHSYVATLYRAVDCTWNAAGGVPREGERLVPDTFVLEHGVAEFVFDSGATLVLEGPARLAIESRQAARLEAGQVVFRNHEDGPPFDLRTPQAVLIDLGTEYAVAVDDAGAEEVHVFEGEVWRSAKQDDSADLIAAGEAKVYAAGGDGLGRRVQLGPERFVRKLPKRARTAAPTSADVIASETFDYNRTALVTPPRGNRGVGWAQPWSGTTERLPGLPQPDTLVDLSRQSLYQTGISKIQRRLAEGLRLDVDANYYFRFRCRFDRVGDDSPNAIFLTLRSTPQEPGKPPGSRLVAHVNASRPLLITRFQGETIRRFTAIAAGVEYLVIGKIAARQAEPDQVLLYFTPSDVPLPDDEPAQWTMIGPIASSDLTLDSVAIHAISTEGIEFDDLRITRSWPAIASDEP